MARRLAQLATLPVTELEGVGDKRAEALAKLDLRSVLDLLTYYPRRYLDRTNERRIDELDVGEEAMVLATVKGVTARRTKTRKSMVVVDLTDGSGFLRATFFNQPFRERQLRSGMSTVLFGKVEMFNGRRQMTNPVVDLVGDKTGRIVADVPAVGEGRRDDVGRRQVDGRGAAPGRRLRRSGAVTRCWPVGT